MQPKISICGSTIISVFAIPSGLRASQSRLARTSMDSEHNGYRRKVSISRFYSAFTAVGPKPYYSSLIVVRGFYERPVREFPLLSAASHWHALFSASERGRGAHTREGERTSAQRYTVTVTKRDTQFVRL